MISRKRTGFSLLVLVLVSMFIVSAVSAATTVAISPVQDEYVRGDTLTIQTTGVTDGEDFYIQFKRSSTVLWVDQDVVSGTTLDYVLKVPSTWYGGTYTVNVKASDSGSTSTTFSLNAPSPPSGGGTTPPPVAWCCSTKWRNHTPMS